MWVAETKVFALSLLIGWELWLAGKNCDTKVRLLG